MVSEVSLLSSNSPQLHVKGTIARQDSYGEMDCTGDYSTTTHTLDACVSPTVSGLLVDSKWTFIDGPTTSPSTAPNSLSSPSTTVTPLVPTSSSTSPSASVMPSSGSASPSASVVPSSGVASPSAAPGQLVDGFIVMSRYTDKSCNVFAKAASFRLNNCADDGKGRSNIATLQSNSLKVKSFSDTTCTTEIGAKSYTYTDACIDGLRYSISSTGVPSLTVPSVSVR